MYNNVKRTTLTCDKIAFNKLRKHVQVPLNLFRSRKILFTIYVKLLIVQGPIVIHNTCQSDYLKIVRRDNMFRRG